ncbi:thioredoxin domain-containing protein [Dactylococcopsis salina]|uniref:hypothetical protein n=1 Tax=Dactylococcopsis salina TaxID=292566 RepID=UPI0003163FFD|nr:hypothetical protein [Dactylococcopsis salina]
MKLFSFIVLCLTVFISVLLSSQIAVNAEQTTVVVDFYYSETCPHCAKEKPLLNYIAQQNEQVTGELEYNSAYQAYLGYKNQIINAIQDHW